ncbi:hypothetical protein INR49_028281 [Caranx melampygus]|nr:hypothetical protein INR49_028281 [Caranx melampygus]
MRTNSRDRTGMAYSLGHTHRTVCCTSGENRSNRRVRPPPTAGEEEESGEETETEERVRLEEAVCLLKCRKEAKHTSPPCVHCPPVCSHILLPYNQT